MKSFLSNKNNLMTYGVVVLLIILIIWLTIQPSKNVKSQPQRSTCKSSNDSYESNNSNVSYDSMDYNISEKPKQKMVIPIGGGKNLALTKEQFDKLQEKYGGQMRREGFYVSNQDYIPSVQTENEYSPMLSLYKPKEQTRITPEPKPAPSPVPVPSSILPAPVPVPYMTGTSMTGTYVDNLINTLMMDNLMSGTYMTGTNMTGSNNSVEGYGNIFIDNFTAPTTDPNAEKYRQDLAGLSPFFLNNGKVTNGQLI
jgi:hypothetical protein